jgi:FlaA1/EpsC-like NDP-sugar epimerase
MVLCCPTGTFASSHPEQTSVKRESLILPRLLLRARNRHLLLTDLLLLPLAAILAFALRIDITLLRAYTGTMLIYAIAAPIIKLPIFAGLGLYARFWQYAGTDEMMLLVWAAAIGALAQGALFLGTQAFFPTLLVPGVPRSIPLIDALVTFAVIAAPRFALRAGALNAQRAGKEGEPNGPLQHVLIAGAGEAARRIVK